MKCPECKGDGEIGGYTPYWSDDGQRLDGEVCPLCDGEGDAPEEPMCLSCNENPPDDDSGICEFCRFDLLFDLAADAKMELEFECCDYD